MITLPRDWCDATMPIIPTVVARPRCVSGEDIVFVRPRLDMPPLEMGLPKKVDVKRREREGRGWRGKKKTVNIVLLGARRNNNHNNNNNNNNNNK